MKIAFHSLLVLSLAALLHGCGDEKSKTINTPDGKATVTTDANGERTALTVDTPEGKVTYKTDKGKVVMEGPQGKAAMETDASGVTKMSSTDKDGKETKTEMSGNADLAAFEGMLYPGAKAEEGGSFNMKTGDMSTATTSFWSDDAPDKVVEHYKKLFPKAMSTTIESMTSIAGKKADGSDFSIAIAPGEGNGKTKLTLMVIKTTKK